MNANRHTERFLQHLFFILRIWLTAILFINHCPGWCFLLTFHKHCLLFVAGFRHVNACEIEAQRERWKLKKTIKSEYTSFDNYFFYFDGVLETFLRMYWKLFSSLASHEFTRVRMGHTPEENKWGDALSCFACESFTSFYGSSSDSCRRLSEDNQIESVLMAHE